MATDRTTLRRRVSRLVKEPFFREMGSANTDSATGGTTTTVVTGLTGLWDEDDAWNEAWIYVVTGDNAGEERRVTDYVASSGTFTVAPAFDNAITSGDTYEIHGRASATDKHDAIDRALGQAWPHFHSLVERDLVIPKDVVELTSSEHLPTTWRQLSKVWLEPSNADVSDEFDVASATSTTVTVTPDPSWSTDEHKDKEVRLFTGTGRGQIRTISSNTSDTLTVATAWDTTPDTTTDLVIVDVTDMAGSWSRVSDIWPVGTNSLQRLLLPSWLQSWLKYKIRLEGVNAVSSLSSDSDTIDDHMTEYVVYQAAAILLLESTIEGISEDSEREERLGAHYLSEAERYKTAQGQNLPNSTMWSKPTGWRYSASDGAWWPSSPLSGFSYSSG